MEADKMMPIAIVGMSCRFPDEATDPEKFWDMIIRKKSARKETPPDRFNVDAFYHPNPDRAGTMINRGGHYLQQDVAAFDAPFFSISPSEAVAMDPQQRLLLELVYEATESAGIPISRLAGTNTSCFVGCLNVDYKELQDHDKDLMAKYHAIGTGRAIISNRLSFFFDLKGPSVTLDTACSTGLVGLHLACQSMRTGESNAAIVAASSIIINPGTQIDGTKLGFFSPDSVCYSFDSRANGYARGEGVAALVLKPLHQALKDNDTVRAVIRGSAVNCDGRTAGITLPSKEAQSALIRAAYEQAGCDSSLTGYFEAHGTGTVGDKIEAAAIGNAVGSIRSGEEGEEKLYVGSVKSNIGHLEGASGLAGIIKVVLSMEKGIIAPNVWFEKGNAEIDFENWKIHVPTESVPWPDGLRRVSVNSFGYGGTNAHVILDDAHHYLQLRGMQGNHCTKIEQGKEFTSDPQRPLPRIFFISANTDKSLDENAKALASYVENRSVENEEAFLNDLAYTLCERRSTFPVGVAIVASSRQELATKLTFGLIHVQSGKEAPKLGFVFTGQGAQWWAMGRELIDHPTFNASLRKCEEAMQNMGVSWSLLEELRKDKTASRIDEIAVSQPLCTAVQVALVDLFASWNIRPVRAIGHSSGEIATAYVSGAVDLKTSMKLAYSRAFHASNACKQAKVPSTMMAGGLSEKEAEAEIKAMGEGFGKVVLGCINSPRSVTFSGDLPGIEELQKRLVARGIFARKLGVGMGFHSHHMDPVAEGYRRDLADIQVVPFGKRNAVEMFSTVTGERITEHDLDAKFWGQSVIDSVRFSAGLWKMCEPVDGVNPVDMLIELGPHSALAGPSKQVLEAMPNPPNPALPYTSALLRGRDAHRTALDVAAGLLAHGYPVNISAVQFPKGKGAGLSVLGDLPPYCWNHDRTYWNESRLSRDYRLRLFGRNDILGAPCNDWNSIEPRWRNVIRLSEQPWLKAHAVQGSILYPAGGYCCMALQAAWQMSVLQGMNDGISEYKLRDVSFGNALVIPETDPGVDVVFSMHPQPVNSLSSSDSWNEFRVFSHTPEGGWKEHCRGLVAISYSNESNQSTTSAYDDLAKVPNAMIIDKKEFYQALNNVGIAYGPEFQGLVDISAGKDVALAKVQAPDTRSSMPQQYETDYLIHPVTLDSFFQVVCAAWMDGNLRSLNNGAIPTFLKEVTVPGNVSTAIGQRFHVTAKITNKGSRDIEARISASDEQTGSRAVAVDGFKLVQLPRADMDETSSSVRELCTKAVWKPDVDLLTSQDMAKQLKPPNDSDLTHTADLQLLAWHFLDKTLKKVKQEGLIGISAHHRKLLGLMQRGNELVLAQKHEWQAPEWTTKSTPDTIAKIERLIEEFSMSPAPEARLLVRVGQSLPGIVNQEIDPLALMTEDNLLDEYYSKTTQMTWAYDRIAQYVDWISHKNPGLSYLQVGAIPDILTGSVLRALCGPDDCDIPKLKSYTYTNAASECLDKAAEAFKKWDASMSFRQLDIGQDPHTQGFESLHFDVVLAANLPHASVDLDCALPFLRKLLRPRGKLILLDAVRPLLSTSMIFGALLGFWNCSTSTGHDEPYISNDRLDQMLHKNAFISKSSMMEKHEHTRIVVAVADEVTSPVQKTVAPKAIVLSPPTTWDFTVVTEEILSEAKAGLQSRGLDCEVVGLQDLRYRDMQGTICISFLEFCAPMLPDISPMDFAILQRLAREAAGIFWVTHGASSSQPNSSLFHGLARSLRAEHEGWPCITIDFDVDGPLALNRRVPKLLMDVYDQTIMYTSQFAVMEQEYLEQDGILHIKRAVVDSVANRRIAARIGVVPMASLIQELPRGVPHKLEMQTVGSFDSFVWKEDSASLEDLPDGHVEIQIHAVGLNVRDLVTAAGETNDGYFGQECAGVVVKVGANPCKLREGDRVAALCLGSFSTQMRLPVEFVEEIPDTMTFAQAAALPLAVVTAYYSLVHVAHLTEGEKVLIHEGASPIGQGAIQLAKSMDAKIFVTVASEAQKKLLVANYGIEETQIFSSCDISFATAVQEATNGDGVDVVLNSLPGEALQVSWQCLGSFGRFVDISKRDSEVNGRLSMAPFVKNRTFSLVDIPFILKNHPKLVQKAFNPAMDLVVAGVLKAADPLSVEPSSKLGDAFRTMQSNAHMGKIVLELRQHDQVKVMSKAQHEISFRTDASYLLAGGLGGIGRSISRWMVRRGAKNLILVSRSGVNSKDVELFIEDLKAQGTRCEILQCDIADTSALSSALSSALESLPPIRGVVQGAMVLNDRMFADMSHDAFMSAVRPKVRGSWSLHEATLSQPLDFFVLLSSLSGFAGNAGQANYAAGCAYQVALASYRHGLLLPATAIDLGRVSQVGYLASNVPNPVDRHLKAMTALEIGEDELLAMMELAMLPREDGIQNGHLITDLHPRAESAFANANLVLSHLVHRETSRLSTSSSPSNEHKPLSVLLSSTNDAEKRCDFMLDALCRKISRMLMMNPEDINPNQMLGTYITDSLMLVELRNWLSKEAKAEMAVFGILLAGNVKELALVAVEKSMC